MMINIFLKGKNIGNCIRLTFDIIDFTDVNNIPGVTLSFDAENAFDVVNHDFLFEVFKRFILAIDLTAVFKQFNSCRVM